MAEYKTAPCSVCERETIVTSTGHVVSHRVFDMGTEEPVECKGSGYYPKGHVMTEGRNTKDQVVHPHANPEMAREKVTQAQCQFCRRMVAVNLINGTMEAHDISLGNRITCKGTGRAWTETIDPRPAVETLQAPAQPAPTPFEYSLIPGKKPLMSKNHKGIEPRVDTRATDSERVDYWVHVEHLARARLRELGEGIATSLTEYKESLSDAPGSEHYTKFPGGVEPIMLTRHLSFCAGNVVKYTARAGTKGGAEGHIMDLKKAIQYAQWELENVEKVQRELSAMGDSLKSIIVERSQES